MELNASERVFLIGMLRDHPTSFIVLKLVNRVLGGLSMSEEELGKIKAVCAGCKNPHKECTCINAEGGILWNPQLAEGHIKEIEIDEILVSFIASKLKALDAQQQLTWQHYSLYEKFVEGGGNKDELEESSE